MIQITPILADYSFEHYLNDKRVMSVKKQNHQQHWKWPRVIKLATISNVTDDIPKFFPLKTITQKSGMKQSVTRSF